MCILHKDSASHTSAAPRRWSNTSHSTDSETEAQAGRVPYLRSRTLGVLSWVWDQGCLIFNISPKGRYGGGGEGQGEVPGEAG